MKIYLQGAGYVGLSNGLLLARKSNVTIVDNNPNVISKLKNKECHIDDLGCQAELKNTTANFELPTNVDYLDADVVLLALPTDYDEKTNNFNTSILDASIEHLSKIHFKGVIVIKSTIPIGYTESKKTLFKNLKLVFSPEFLREGSSFEDVQSPSRIIFGSKEEWIIPLSKLYEDVSNLDSPVIFTDSNEAESVKLFSNTYLAMRVAFVNELSTFALKNNLNKDDVIKGVTMDPRIGKHYFKPSLGYGGYCLPKDSKQLRYEYNSKKIANTLFDAIVESNEVRKKFIVEQVISSGHRKIIINGLNHKPNVKNFRNSPQIDIAKMLIESNIEVVLVDENFVGEEILGIKVVASASGVELSSFI